MSRSKPPKQETTSTPRPSPSGHTESIRARLAERREKLGLDPDTVWERLVAELTERRAERGLKAEDVARSLRESEDDAAADAPMRGTRIWNYEKMDREPRIDEFAAWARAVGMRLIVELEPADSPRKAVMMSPEKADLAKTLDRLDPASTEDATTIAEALIDMSPAKVAEVARLVTIAGSKSISNIRRLAKFWASDAGDDGD